MTRQATSLRPASREAQNLHPSAREVLEILGDGPQPGNDLAAIRRRYNLSRRPMLAPLEPVENLIHIEPGSNVAPRLTVIYPRGYRLGDRLPALVFLHGGGWVLGSLATYEPFCRQLANACNMILIWVEYRLAPEAPFPAAYDDTIAAWRWVQENYQEVGCDPDRIMIGGDSAGGNLAAAAALALRGGVGIQPWRQILLYPCLDMSASLASHRRFANGYLLTAPLYAWYRSCYAGNAPDPHDWRLSPLFVEALGDLPPTLLLSAGFDPLRDEAAAYAMKLMISGVAVEMLHFEDMIHGFLTMGGAIPTANTAIERIAERLSLLDS